MTLVDTNQNRRIPTTALVAICAVAIVLAIFVAWRNMAPPAPVSALTAAETKAAGVDEQTTEWMRHKAKETGGDVNKLSPADQAKLATLTRGNGALVLKTMAEK
ncbi:MAG: hypothetical protein H8F28_17270 [Fibrella sp.]|nr:hypothetical protein [Armatimonadota bacterium]